MYLHALPCHSRILMPEFVSPEKAMVANRNTCIEKRVNVLRQQV
jgi:hypothetical protein